MVCIGGDIGGGGSENADAEPGWLYRGTEVVLEFGMDVVQEFAELFVAAPQLIAGGADIWGLGCRGVEAGGLKDVGLAGCRGCENALVGARGVKELKL